MSGILRSQTIDTRDQEGQTPAKGLSVFKSSDQGQDLQLKVCSWATVQGKSFVCFKDILANNHALIFVLGHAVAYLLSLYLLTLV